MDSLSALFNTNSLSRQVLLWAVFLVSLCVVTVAHRTLFRLFKRRADLTPGVLDASIVQTVSTPTLFIFL